ncbi:MAG: HlyD family efflux transporter periplasmic adaptor subunit [Patescibacteria group bacterium]
MVLVVIAILAVAGGGYWSYSAWQSAADEQTRYVLAAAEKGTVIVSVTGSGQVSASNTVELKTKASGDVTAVRVANGQDVKAGSMVVQVDDRAAQTALRDARTDLETARLELEQLLAPADELTLFQAENALAQAQESVHAANDDRTKAYEDELSAVADTFLELPTVMGGLADMFFDNTINTGQENIDWYANQVSYDLRIFTYKADLLALYQKARTAYDTSFEEYKSVNRSSDRAAVEVLTGNVYETVKTITDTVKAAHDYIDFVVDEKTQHSASLPVLVSTHTATLNTYTGTVNNALASLFSALRSVDDAKQAIISAERSVRERELSLKEITAGADELDIRAHKIIVQQREDALVSAEQVLADHAVRAPFDGVIAKVDVQHMDSVGSGAIVATLITKQRFAEISLNEIDAATVQVGQKATVTFDAIEGLGITGQVAEVDAIGTVTQGVVTYNIKIGFDTQDDRVKPGMSVSAAVITDMRQDVLTVPNGAVKMQGDAHYVEMFDEPLFAAQDGNQGVPSAVPPQRRSVEIGISSDTHTQITAGINEGDEVVTRTIGTTTQTATQTAPSIFGAAGVRTPGTGGTTRTGTTR